MDSPAAIPAARLRHSKHLQLNRLTLTAVINASILVLLSCRWAGPQPRLDTGAVAGPSPACLHSTISRYRDALAYDIVVQFFSHDTSPTLNILFRFFVYLIFIRPILTLYCTVTYVISEQSITIMYV